MKRKIVILGSTGSIGENCLEVIRANREKFDVVGLSARSNVKKFLEQVDEFKPKKVALSNAGSFLKLKKGLSSGTKILAGEDSLTELVESLKSDVVVSGIVGSAGLIPTMAAIKKGIRVGIANKEPLVMAGKIITAAAKRCKATIIPIDSEHSAIWQCLNGEPKKRIKKIVLTASGGPFMNKSLKQLKNVTPAEALNHPKWKMGNKISIDSATMMNKGLEVIEARWLFNMPPEKIEVLIHPQSIVHSMVEFEDTSVIAQMGVPDMKVPIAYALSYPDRWPASLKSLDLSKEKRLDFASPDLKRFPCLKLAFDALSKGSVFPSVLNAANEVAVEAFLAGKIGFMEIPKLIKKALFSNSFDDDDSLKGIIAASSAAREIVSSILKR